MRILWQPPEEPHLIGANHLRFNAPQSPTIYVKKRVAAKHLLRILLKPPEEPNLIATAHIGKELMPPATNHLGKEQGSSQTFVEDLMATT